MDTTVMNSKIAQHLILLPYYSNLPIEKNLKRSDKYVALSNLNICYKLKSIKE